jgi:hypothetical protein
VRSPRPAPEVLIGIFLLVLVALAHRAEIRERA